MHQVVVKVISTGTDTWIVAAIAAGAALLSALITGFVTERMTRSRTRENLRQQRLRDAYVTIQIYVNGWDRYAKWAVETFAAGEEPPLPRIEDEPEAVASLMASREIVAEVERFSDHVDSFSSAIQHFQYARSQQDIDIPGSAEAATATHAAMRSLASVVIDDADGVYRQMRSELRSD